MANAKISQISPGTPALDSIIEFESAGGTSGQNTLAAILALGGGGVSTAAYASPPSAPTTGMLWMPVDAPYNRFRYSGSAWVPYTADNMALAIPSDTGGAWANQGTATITNLNGPLRLTSATDTADSWKLRYYTQPTPPYTITCLLRAFVPGANYSGVGVGWRQSSDGKWILAYWDYESGYGLGVGSNLVGQNGINTNRITRFASSFTPWVRFGDDNTNRFCDTSTDGVFWSRIYTEARTTQITADQVAIAINPRNSAGGIPILDVMSWKVT